MANTQASFDAARTIFSSLLGIGVRKRHPSLRTIGDVARNPVSLQIDDTIYMCDELRHNNNLTDNWFDPEAKALSPSALSSFRDGSCIGSMKTRV